MPKSNFHRFLDRPRPLWQTLLIGLLLFVLPMLGAYLDGALPALWKNGLWRAFLTPSAIIFYILLIAPPVNRVNGDVVQAFRSAALVDDERYIAVIEDATRVPRWGEPAAILGGIAFGLLINLSSYKPGGSWLFGIILLLICLMYGLLGLVIYMSIDSTRLVGALHRLPLRIDIFDITPFEAIGRQGLVLALVFVGGITLSLLFAYRPQSLQAIQFWLIYLILGLVPVVVFFLTMRPTHAVLADEKKRQLKRIEQLIHQGDQTLVERLEAGQEAGAIAAQQTALALYEKRIQEARSWPYNTGMLRTLFVSVLIPGFTMFGKLFLDYFFP